MNEIERAIAYYEQTLESIKHMMVECELKDEIVSAHETALTVLRAELARQDAKPLTWNERINQMTVEEKAKWLYNLDVCRVSSISIDECNSYRRCTECMRNMLAGPYTEGETT